MKRFITAVVTAILILSAITAEDTFKGYHQADTAHFTFVFDADGKSEAERFAAYADDAWEKIAKAYGMPQDKTMVFINSNTDVINAFAMGESNYMGLYTTPNNIIDFGFRTNWHETFFTHELIHIANMNFEGRKPEALSWFGTYLPLMDTSRLPGYALEGLTTVLETELTAGGRGRSPYWEMMYKAPAMENNMITYAEIGKGSIPPTGQNYVYGYLISRAVADRYGLDALASIERNRELFGKWDEAVHTVTGEYPDDILTDVKKALDKRYAQERTIPEGITISPRSMGVYCYPKPVFLDCGCFITMRSYWDETAEIVLYDPENQTEEILVSAYPEDFTADENLSVVFSSSTSIMHKGNGAQSVTDLYRYDYLSGKTTQLTTGSSYFQPSLSRNGNRLVACQLYNGRYRIVEISLEDGSATPILESPDKDFMYPQLSATGSKLTCLEANDTRAAVAVCDMPKVSDDDRTVKNYKVIYNDAPEGAAPTEIFDPGYPSFNGNLITFASNERGRLELFSCNLDGSDCQPVLSDPVGVLWATTQGNNIFYSSYASTGYVVKAKPLSEWGNVPDFEGPSKPGEIITFGSYISDYEDYEPYTRPQVQYAQRSDEMKNAIVTKTTAPSGILNSERYYIDLPHLLVLTPTISTVEGPKATWYYGFGIEALGMSHIKQSNSSVAITEASLLYYPEINQFSGNLLFTEQKGAAETIINLSRSVVGNAGTYGMTEKSTGILSYTFPLYVVENYFHMHDTALILGGSVEGVRTNPEPFGINDDISFDTTAQITAGIETSHRFGSDTRDYYADFGAATTLTCQEEVTQFLYEADAGISLEFGMSWLGVTAKGRWFDLPKGAAVPTNITTLKASNVDCEYPGRVIMDIGYGITYEQYLVTCFLQKMVSFGTNSDTSWYDSSTGPTTSLTIDPVTYVGLESSIKQGRIIASAGMVIPVSNLIEEDWKSTRFYLSVKANGIRVSIPGLEL